MKIVLFLWHHSRRMVVIAALASVISGLINAVLITFINGALHSSGEAWQSLVLGFAAICAANLFFEVLSQICVVRVAQNALFDLRVRLSKRILAAPLRKLEDLGAPRLLANLTDDIYVLLAAVNGIPMLCVHIVVIVACFGYLAWLSLPVALTVMTVFILGFLVVHFAATRVHHTVQRARDEGDLLFEHFRGITEGAKELKLNRRRSAFFLDHLLKPKAGEVRRYHIVGHSLFAAITSTGNMVYLMLIGFVLIVLPQWVAVAPEALTGATLVILYLRGPVDGILGWLPMVERTKVSFGKLELLGGDFSAEPAPEKVGECFPDHWQSLTFEKVTHSYFHEQRNGRFRLGPLNFELRRGELVYVIGGNGGGKTTLAKVVSSLYPPESGHIRLDDREITEENRTAFRQLFSMVFSDFYLFEHLMAELGPEMEARANHYLKKLQLHRKLRVADGRFSTIDLSRGQRKRLALLSAYLEDRPIVIFDEWAADQDPVFKEFFYTSLLPEMKAEGKTLLVITHDDKYFHLADRLLKLDYGQLQLLSSNPFKDQAKANSSGTGPAELATATPS